MEKDTITKTENRYQLSILLMTEEDRGVVDELLRKYEISFLQDREMQKTHLAYPIQKQSYAFLWFLTFSTDAEKVVSLSHDLRFVKGVLRHLVQKVSTSNNTQIPSHAPSRVTQSTSRLSRPVRKPVEPMLTNEDLEKKIEEILQ